MDCDKNFDQVKDISERDEDESWFEAD